MLDENLPTFYFRPSSSDPLQTVLAFTQNGSDTAAEYLFRKADPTQEASKNKYASALSDAMNPSILFAEVVISPEWTQPNLSAAEIRANNGVPPPQVPMIPESFAIQLFNPDQQVAIKGEKSTWTGKESWDFEMPQVSFLKPSKAAIDQQLPAGSPENNSAVPKIMFRWKRDSKFSKDMTCFMTGRSVQGRKSKEPDITIAMFRCGGRAGEQSLTIYEPNLQRVEVEDRKGLEVVLLLGAEVIREIYLFPSRDSFNIAGSTPPSKRKNSRPISPGQAATSAAKANGYTMSGAVAVGDVGPAGKTGSPVGGQKVSQNSRTNTEVEAENRRLQAAAEQERKEKEKRDREEQKRIKKLIEDEEKERKRKEAEVAKETERLRKLYGMEGQDYGPRPDLPPRPQNGGPPQASNNNNNNHNNGAGSSRLNVTWNNTQAPARPVSVGPPPKNSGGGSSGFSRFFHGSGDGYAQHSHSQSQGGGPVLQQQQPPKSSRRRKSDEGTKIKKKKSTFF